MSSAIKDLPKPLFQILSQSLKQYAPGMVTSELGVVVNASSGVAHLRGLTDVSSNELIKLPNDLMGLATSISEAEVGLILLGEGETLRLGDRGRCTGRVVDAPVGEALLGRVVDALGRPLDEGGAIQTSERWPIERAAPAIIDRAPVSEPLQTGIKAIDALIPIGRGQRELIVGDRQTGKTAIALSAMINQQAKAVKCIYCAIGQRTSAVARVISELEKSRALSNTIVVVAGGKDAPGLQYVAPYAATTMAEYFMERGDDVLIVYDDLTRHARAYRELSLLLRRPPGREAFPGDIFYIHARLLERATHLSQAQGGGSLTALPIVETQAQDISAYIPTNLISITDGQVYLSPTLFEKGVLPAIDVGKSVSRVGGKAQIPSYRAVSGALRLAYAQFEELEAFARFGTRLDAETQARVERGRRVREVLKQGEHERLAVADQIAALLAVTSGAMDGVDVDATAQVERAVRLGFRSKMPGLHQRINEGLPLDDEVRRSIVTLAGQVIRDLEGEEYQEFGNGDT
jgi:F-type H+-transporting ATPase subunit alpha